MQAQPNHPATKCISLAHTEVINIQPFVSGEIVFQEFKKEETLKTDK